MNPNTIRAVYRRLADAGYVTSRHGAGTHVAERPPQRRGAEALAGIVAEMLRRAAHAGFTADEVAAATFAAATERKRPGPLVRVLFAECTSADAGYDAERLCDEFPGLDRGRGRAPRRPARPARALPLRPRGDDDVPRRRGPGLAAGRVPVVAMLVGPGYVELVHEIAGLPAGSQVGLVCASWRGSDNIRETLTLSGATGVEIVPGAASSTPDDLDLVDQTADVILMSREALAAGLDRRFSRPERIRPWTYDFDPSGLELLRRADRARAPTRRRADPAPTASAPRRSCDASLMAPNRATSATSTCAASRATGTPFGGR